MDYSKLIGLINTQQGQIEEIIKMLKEYTLAVEEDLQKFKNRITEDLRAGGYILTDSGWKQHPEVKTARKCSGFLLRINHLQGFSPRSRPLQKCPAVGKCPSGCRMEPLGHRKLDSPMKTST